MPALVLLLALGATPRIAVLDLEASGVSKELAENVGLILPSAVRRRAPGVGLISGAEIRSLLGFERQKQLVGCASDTSCTAELGEALGVEEMVSGRIGRVGATWVLELRRADVKHGRIAGSAARTVKSEDGLLDAVESAVEELFPAPAAAGPSITRPVAANGGRPTAGWVFLGAGAAVTAGAVATLVWSGSQLQSATPNSAPPGVVPTVTRGDFQSAKAAYQVSWAVAAVGLGLVGYGGYRLLAAPAPGGGTVVVGGQF